MIGSGRMTGYLEGAIPYPPDIIKEYISQGWWLDLTAGDILDRTVSRCCDKVAIVAKNQRITYGQLSEEVNRLAIGLSELGFKKYDRVILQLANGYEYVIAYFAMQKIGVIPLMVVPRFGQVEITAIFELCQPAGWIVPVKDGSRDFIPLVDSVRPQATGLRQVIFVGEDNEKIPAYGLSFRKLIADVQPNDYPANFLHRYRPDPNDVAHIIFTGGTTGRSKAVPRTHNSFLANVRGYNRRFNEDDIFIVSTPMGHAMAFNGPVTGGIYHGATVIMADTPRPKEILEAIASEKGTVVDLVPTQLAYILEYPELSKYDISSVRVIETSGARLDPKLAQQAQDLCGRIGCSFHWGRYGSSEGPAAGFDTGANPEIALKSVGRSRIPGNHWIVIDNDEQELPPNSIGELAVKGPAVFTGYYKSSEDNEGIFTRKGYYKTGDIGKIDNEGYIFIIDRKKDVIQRGGESIAPKEIEDLISLHPAVEKVAVIGMPDAYMGERACAYVVPKMGKVFAFEEMISFLKLKQAGVLLWPERLEIIDKLPETEMGKVDKPALRKDIAQKLEIANQSKD